MTDKLEGTCSVCLRLMQLRGSSPIRHGFSAQNVRHGQTGGWHTGPCFGTQFPHLGISDEGTRAALERVRARRAHFEGEIRTLERQPPLHWAPKLYGKPLRDFSKQITIQPGAKRDYTLGSPSYDELHKRRVSELTAERDTAARAIANYERVIATWSPDKYPTKGAVAKVEVVHLAKLKTRGPESYMGIACNRMLSKWKSEGAKKTEDVAKVTCKACKKTLGLDTRG